MDPTFLVRDSIVVDRHTPPALTIQYTHADAVLVPGSIYDPKLVLMVIINCVLAIILAADALPEY
jgi:hypothetical protein